MSETVSDGPFSGPRPLVWMVECGGTAACLGAEPRPSPGLSHQWRGGRGGGHTTPASAPWPCPPHSPSSASSSGHRRLGNIQISFNFDCPY